MKITGVDVVSARQQLPPDFAARLWARDASLWKSDEAVQASIRNRLGWLSLPEDMSKVAGLLSAFAADIRRAGFTRAVLLGMGGSSLAPEVLRLTFGAAKGGLPLSVLDTTDPERILAVERKGPLKKTLFIVSSKSGGTIEVMSLFKYFFSKVETLRGGAAGNQFIAVTDPGTSLEKLAREKGFRKIFTAPEDVGGRFSALTYFGLVPAALLGVDVARLIGRASVFTPGVPSEADDAVLLGAVLGLLGKAGRDKVTFLLSKEIASFGLWAEQLIAESTGKEGRGIVPVEGEGPIAPKDYGKDRVFVSLAVGGRHPASIKALEAAGHPVVRIDLKDRYDLGREFMRFELATAAAGAVLGVNPFDEPNVSESKSNTGRILAQLGATGKLPEEAPLIKTRTVSAWADAALSRADSLQDVLTDHLARARTGDYVALMAYLPPTPATHRLLQSLRAKVREATGVAVTLGYGPRFLHSTGQLHKGGDDNGLFLQITADDSKDASVPGAGYGFSALKRAQALGDFQALKAHTLRVLRLHLTSPAGLAAVSRLIRPSRRAPSNA